MVLEPLYEQDFLDCSYGFRPGRSAHQALDIILSKLWGSGGGWVMDVDLRKFFGAPGQAWCFQRVKFPHRQGGQPPHRESSLGRMEATT